MPRYTIRAIPEGEHYWGICDETDRCFLLEPEYRFNNRQFAQHVVDTLNATAEPLSWTGSASHTRPTPFS